MRTVVIRVIVLLERTLRAQLCALCAVRTRRVVSGLEYALEKWGKWEENNIDIYLYKDSKI